MKDFLENLWFLFKKYLTQILCVGIAVRQLIILDWFGAIIAVCVGGVLLIVDMLKK